MREAGGGEIEIGEGDGSGVSPGVPEIGSQGASVARIDGAVASHGAIAGADLEIPATAARGGVDHFVIGPKADQCRRPIDNVAEADAQLQEAPDDLAAGELGRDL